MFQRFGPFDLFSLTKSKRSDLESSLEVLFENCKKSTAKGWKVLKQNRQNIKVLSHWTFSKRQQIVYEFPRTKSGHIYKNRHILIKQFTDNVQPSGRSLYSRGFEGSNYRLVVASDKERNLKCRYGEYLNLSGFLFNFRDDFPKSKHCEICNKEASIGICIPCGQWFCKSCQFICNSCNHEMCVSCSTGKSPNVSVHEWYYHRNEL